MLNNPTQGLELEKRLREVLDGAQYLRTLFAGLYDEGSSGVIDVGSLPQYIPAPDEKMESSLQSITTREAGQNLTARMLNVSSRSLAPRGQEVFWELRETIMVLGQGWDGGERAILVQDSDDASVISVRVSSAPHHCNEYFGLSIIPSAFGNPTSHF